MRHIPEAATVIERPEPDDEAETILDLPALDEELGLMTISDPSFGERGARRPIPQAAATAVMPTDLERWAPPPETRSVCRPDVTAPMRPLPMIPMARTATRCEAPGGVQAHIRTYVFGPTTRQARTWKKQQTERRPIAAPTAFMVVAASLAASVVHLMLV